MDFSSNGNFGVNIKSISVSSGGTISMGNVSPIYEEVNYSDINDGSDGSTGKTNVDFEVSRDVSVTNNSTVTPVDAKSISDDDKITLSGVCSSLVTGLVTNTYKDPKNFLIAVDMVTNSNVSSNISKALANFESFASKITKSDSIVPAFLGDSSLISAGVTLGVSLLSGESLTLDGALGQGIGKFFEEGTSSVVGSTVTKLFGIDDLKDSFFAQFSDGTFSKEAFKKISDTATNLSKFDKGLISIASSQFASSLSFTAGIDCIGSSVNSLIQAYFSGELTSVSFGEVLDAANVGSNFLEGSYKAICSTAFEIALTPLGLGEVGKIAGNALGSLAANLVSEAFKDENGEVQEEWCFVAGAASIGGATGGFALAATIVTGVGVGAAVATAALVVAGAAVATAAVIWIFSLFG